MWCDSTLKLWGGQEYMAQQYRINYILSVIHSHITIIFYLYSVQCVYLITQVYIFYRMSVFINCAVHLCRNHQIYQALWVVGQNSVCEARYARTTANSKHITSTRYLFRQTEMGSEYYFLLFNNCFIPVGCYKNKNIWSTESP